MSLPAPETLLAAAEATWPAAATRDIPGWRLRDGAGGGKRVSAASALVAAPDIAALVAAGGRLALVTEGQALLDAQFAALGWGMVDPVLALAAPVGDLAVPPPPVSAFVVDRPPLAVQAELWAEGGIGAARLAVMARVRGPAVTLLARAQDRPAGTAFAAISGGICLVHAVHVTPALRRGGCARHMMQAAACWARAQGAQHLAVLVTTANAPARALYAGLGMVPVTRYHYRQKDPSP